MPQYANHPALAFEPYFGVGDTVHVLKADGEVDLEIVAVEYMGTRRHDFGDITSSSTGNDVTILDMPDGEMAQYRFFVMGPFWVEMTHPSTTVRIRKSDTTNWRIGPVLLDSPTAVESETMFAASEFWVYQDQTPRFDLYPFSSFSTVRAHVDFYGIRYGFAKSATRGRYTLRVNAWPAVSSV